MKAEQLKKHLTEGALEKYSALYTDIKAQTARFIAAIDTFTSLYGDDRDYLMQDLTEEERAEQKLLREEYMRELRAALRGTGGKDLPGS